MRRKELAPETAKGAAGFLLGIWELVLENSRWIMPWLPISQASTFLILRFPKTFRISKRQNQKTTNMHRTFSTIILGFLLLAPNLNAEEPRLDKKQDQLKTNMAKLDSQIQELNTAIEEGNEKAKQEQFERYMNNNLRNMERLVAERKEEQKKRERWNMFRGLILVITVIAAIVARSAKKKAKNAQDEVNQTGGQNQSE